MNATTKAKLRVLGHGKHLREQMLQHIDEAQLDVRYGGSNVPNFTVPAVKPSGDAEPPPPTAADPNAYPLAFHNQMDVD